MTTKHKIEALAERFIAFRRSRKVETTRQDWFTLAQWEGLDLRARSAGWDYIATQDQWAALEARRMAAQTA